MINLLEHPTDLTYKDIDSMLCRLNYRKIKQKATCVTYQKGSKKIRFHIPHRYKTFQAYQITRLIRDLESDLYVIR